MKFLDKIAEKIILKQIEGLKEKLILNKDEIIQAVKDAIAKYIDEHKEEFLQMFKDKLADVAKDVFNKK